MSGLEAAALTLSTAVIKSAAKLWLGDRNAAADISASAIDLISARATSLLERRQIQRTFEELIDTVTRKLTPYIESEFRNLPANEKAAAVFAVSETFGNASYSDNYLFSSDLNAAYIDRYLRTKSPNIAKKELLSEDATSFYDILLRECCEYLVQVTLTLPQFQVGALTEILRRNTEIITALENILSRLPERVEGRSRDSFSVDYRRQVINQLDRMELFGATLSESRRRYPLSVAYISLSLSIESETPLRGVEYPEQENIDLSIDQALVTSQRLFIRGEAGSGKSTLIKWIAVRSARQGFTRQLESWNDAIPFFVPLRRYVEARLPSPEEFPETVGRFIADEMPPDYVRATLRSGRGLILIDGLDEFPERKREAVRSWLNDLISSYPHAKYVITSRPGAVATGWLNQEHFNEFELLPMSLPDIRAFIRHWHEAMRRGTSDVSERIELTEFEQKAIDRITSRRHLRSLAETPLLCALLCALHSDRRGHLPNNRMELYDVALEMLLERRDAEHHVLADTMLSRTEKTLLLQDIAYWLIRNGWSDAEKSQVIKRIEAKMQAMSQINVQPTTIYRHLLERSGLIREPVMDRVDFIHRTFQEYLAALDALTQDDIGLLVDRAHLDQWREVIIMASGHAYAPKRETLLRALLQRGDHDVEHRDKLHLLAVACLETSPELSVDLRNEIRERVQDLLPPKNLTAAKSLASAGDFVVDLLAQAKPELAKEVAATIRAASEIGSEAALRVIVKYRRDDRFTVYKELLRAWSQFDAEEYARDVLAHSRFIAEHPLFVENIDLIPGLRYLSEVKDLHLYVVGVIDLEILRNFPSLRVLSIGAGASLTNSSVLAYTTGLESLTVYRRDFDDSSVLSSLLRLQDLDLSGTDITELFGITGLTKLRNLNLSDTGITDLTPLAGLKELRALQVDATGIIDLSPLRNLSKLVSLTISDTRVSDLSPLNGLTALRTLDLDGSGVSDLSPIANIRALYDLDLSLTKVQELPSRVRWEELESLDISDTGISNLSPLVNAPVLGRLNANRTPIENLDPLASLTNLRWLSLEGTRVRDLSPLVPLSHLRSLFVAGTGLNDLGPLRKRHFQSFSVDVPAFKQTRRQS